MRSRFSAQIERLTLCDAAADVSGEQAVSDAGESLRLPDVHVLATKGAGAESRLSPHLADRRVNTSVVEDVEMGWAAVRGVGAGDAILVRPDGHVAWRSAGLTSGSVATADKVMAAEVEEGGDEEDPPSEADRLRRALRISLWHHH